MCDQNVQRQFEEMLRDHCAEYHNHKETMAHAALVIQLGLFAWIMMADVWPPKWVNDINIYIHMPKEWVTLAVYSLIWLTIFGYTMWQFLNRRRGALLVASLINNIKKGINYEPKDEITEKYFKKIEKQIKRKRFPWFPWSDFFICLGYILILILVWSKTLSKTLCDV